MRTLALLLVAAVGASASLLDDNTPVTLDSAEMARIWQEVKTGQKAAAPQSGDSWQAAMLAEDAELARVLLLAWLQQQNPQISMAGNAAAYAHALRLHLGALAGQSAACSELAQAYRSGMLGLLALPVSESKARWFEQRALSAGNLPE